MKLKYIFYMLIFMLYSSCNETNHKIKSKSKNNNLDKNGLIIYFSSQFQDKLQLSINDIVVYDSIVYYNMNDFSNRMEILTDVIDSVGYHFNVKFSNKEKTFFLPSKGLNKIIISYGGVFDIELIENKSIENDKFTIYLSKNIEDNCNVKIAADSDTLYNGKFINNYPPKYFNTMELKYNKNKNKKINFYVEIWNTFIYFDCIPAKYCCVKVNLDYSYRIATNLDGDWEAYWSLD